VSKDTTAEIVYHTYPAMHTICLTALPYVCHCQWPGAHLLKKFWIQAEHVVLLVQNAIMSLNLQSVENHLTDSRCGWLMLPHNIWVGTSWL